MCSPRLPLPSSFLSWRRKCYSVHSSYLEWPVFFVLSKLKLLIYVVMCPPHSCSSRTIWSACSQNSPGTLSSRDEKNKHSNCVSSQRKPPLLKQCSEVSSQGWLFCWGYCSRNVLYLIIQSRTRKLFIFKYQNIQRGWCFFWCEVLSTFRGEGGRRKFISENLLRAETEPLFSFIKMFHEPDAYLNICRLYSLGSSNRTRNIKTIYRYLGVYPY